MTYRTTHPPVFLSLPLVEKLQSSNQAPVIMMIGIMISRVIVCTKLVEVLKSLSADRGYLKIIPMNKLFTWAIYFHKMQDIIVDIKEICW